MINDLLKDPKKFFDEGKSYDLLQEYFTGISVSSLDLLLKHENLIVKRVAIWIVSELGDKAITLKESVLSLLQEKDRYLQYYTFESIMLFSASRAKSLFHYLMLSLESDDDVIRKLGMHLISNASNIQLEEAIQYYSKIGEQIHTKGLALLLNTQASEKQIESMFFRKNKISPRYIAIFLKQNIKSINQEKQEKILTLLDKANDSSVKIFLNSFLNY